MSPKQCSKKFFCISTAAVLSFAVLISLILLFALRPTSHHHQASESGIVPSGLPPSVRNACKFSNDTAACEYAIASSGQLPKDPTALQIIEAVVGVSSKNLTTAKSMVDDILKESVGNLNRSVTAKTCLETFGYAENRMRSVEKALRGGEIKDARAWMSAVVGYQYGCWSSLKRVNDTEKVNTAMAFMWSLLGLTSDALGMLVNYDRIGNETGSWRLPETERDGFWEKDGRSGSGSATGGGVPSGLIPNVTVCLQKSGCHYQKVQDAVNAAPDFISAGKFVIQIKAGVYEEIVRVPFNKTNVVFLGEGMGKTVITGNLSVGLPPFNTTYHSATVAVVGDGFMARDLTIRNTAPAGAHQAVAFRSDSDHSIVESCEFLGNQDTLCANSLRQYYKSCRIQGNVDFIFGSGAAVFHDCRIFVTPRQEDPEKPADNAVTAHGRIYPGQSTGFVFQNCTVNGTEEYMELFRKSPDSFNATYLGRPWKEYSRTVFIQCTLEGLVSPAGWMPWDGEFALETIYYGELNNTGAGAGTAERVKWSSRIPAEHVHSYSLDNFIQGHLWIPLSQ
ncbi:unnamed protein product [Cuscuta campestris]|uniref:pectinesterase n=1 Tax=Cuscuta campestris TaxID=132261 RepID=A0A484LMX9_9ASTE|nr:unnamed protein product [Cuscuta campestris]